MKKLLAVFAIATILLTSGLAGLSLMPHSHGADLDHSQHQSCPVYQFGLGHSDALSITVALTFFLLLARYFSLPEAQSSFQRVSLFHPLRAPPTIS